MISIHPSIDFLQSRPPALRLADVCWSLYHGAEAHQAPTTRVFSFLFFQLAAVTFHFPCFAHEFLPHRIPEAHDTSSKRKIKRSVQGTSLHKSSAVHKIWSESKREVQTDVGLLTRMWRMFAL